MTKRAEKWPVIGWWWHHPVMTIGRVGVWVCSPTKLKKTRTATRLKPRYKKHSDSHCPTPSNAKYKESKWLWATQLRKWSFVNSNNFDPTDWNCWEILQNPTVREYMSRCNSGENIHIYKVFRPWDRVIFVGETEAIIREVPLDQSPKEVIVLIFTFL